jgi:hypothetical protein
MISNVLSRSVVIIAQGKHCAKYCITQGKFTHHAATSVFDVRRELLSESRMWEIHKSRFDERDVKTESWSNHYVPLSHPYRPPTAPGDLCNLKSGSTFIFGRPGRLIFFAADDQNVGNPAADQWTNACAQCARTHIAHSPVAAQPNPRPVRAIQNRRRPVD